MTQSCRCPIFTIVAALSLASGVGANTAIFSAVNVLLLRPVPGVVGLDRVVEVGTILSYPNYEDWKASVDAFEWAAAVASQTLSLSTGGDGERITSMHQPIPHAGRPSAGFGAPAAPDRGSRGVPKQA